MMSLAVTGSVACPVQCGASRNALRTTLHVHVQVCQEPASTAAGTGVWPASVYGSFHFCWISGHLRCVGRVHRGCAETELKFGWRWPSTII